MTKTKMVKVICPICKKEIEIKEEGGYIYHRPWMFHIAIDHADLFRNGTIAKEDILLWMHYPWIGDEVFQKEMVTELNHNV